MYRQPPVPRLEIHPFSEEFRGHAATLLRDRHERHRAAEPLLADVDDYAAQIGGRSGAVATRGGAVVAYVVAEVRDRAVVDLAGCAASEHEAHLASGWPPHHQVLVPATDTSLIDPWFRLAFGCQFMTGVREVAPAAPVDFGGTIRPSTPADLRTLAELEAELWRLQAETPSYSGIARPPIEEHEDGWSDLWSEPDTYWSFVAERDDEPVGAIVMYRRPTGDLRVPEDNVDLAFAATWPKVRGSGVGVALTHHVLNWAHEHGFRSMTTDWRSVNLFSSRFWPSRGFRPTFLRLFRSVA
jgi:GNAT superfamily N-acetyltransferase